ncbi:hypothetical protein COP2_039079 [Malus domestica]
MNLLNTSSFNPPFLWSLIVFSISRCFLLVLLSCKPNQVGKRKGSVVANSESGDDTSVAEEGRCLALRPWWRSKIWRSRGRRRRPIRRRKEWRSRVELV